MIQSHILPIFIGYLATSLALIVEHIALRQQPWKLQPPATYIVGTLTILGGALIWALLEPGVVEPLLAVLAFAVIAMGSGAWVLLLYWWDARSTRGQAATHKTSALTEAAKDILRELRGENDPSRHN